MCFSSYAKFRKERTWKDSSKERNQEFHNSITVTIMCAFTYVHDIAFDHANVYI